MAKNGNGFWRKASVLITIIIVTVTIIVGYVTLCNTVGTIKDKTIPAIEKICTKLEDSGNVALQERRKNERDLVEIKSDVSHIKEAIDKNYQTQQEILLELRER